MPHLGEFVWTWNIFFTLFLTLIVLPVLAKMITYSIKRQFENRDQKDKKIAELLALIVNGKAKALADKEDIKADHLDEWRQELKHVQNNIKDRLDEIVIKLEGRVDWDHCNAKMEKIEDRLRSAGK